MTAEEDYTYLTNLQKKRKFVDRDGDNMDDNWEKSVGLHDEQGRHKVPSLNIGGSAFHKNGVIGMHHTHLKSFAGPMKSLKIGEMKPMKLSIDIKQPNLKGNHLKSVKTPNLMFDDSRIKTPKGEFSENYLNAFLDRITSKKKKKNI